MPLPLETPADPRDRVLRQLVAALIFEKLVAVTCEAGFLCWQLGGRDYRCSGRLGPFGRPRIAAASVEMRGDDGSWMPASLAVLLDALPGPDGNRQKLLSELELTVSFVAWNREHIPVRDRRGLSFAGIEAALDEGHPYHPCYKARAGFTAEDNAAYGPEAAQPFQLLWLLVARKHLRQALPMEEGTFWRRELGEETVHALAGRRAALGLSDHDFGLLPVHPWQWRHLRNERLAGWLARGEAAELAA